MRRLRGGAFPLKLATVTAVLLTMFPPVGGPAAHARDDAGVCGANPRHTVVGYLFGDGGPVGGKAKEWTFHNSHPALQEQFGACARLLGATVYKTRFGVHAARLLLNLPLDAVPPDVRGASRPEVESFLAAVIEGEGNQAGKVIDDPSLDHCAVMAQVLKDVDVQTAIGGSLRCAVYARQSDWPIIHGFPFVEWDRVPGGP